MAARLVLATSDLCVDMTNSINANQSYTLDDVPPGGFAPCSG